MNSYNAFANSSKTSARPLPQSKRLLDQMRERLRYMHYALSTEKTYLYWVRWYIRFHGLRHPREEVGSVLSLMDGIPGLLARLLYGTGMRHMEGLSLRVKDVDFDRHVIVVRDGKGGTDIRTVQELLGHSDVSTTMIYTHVLKVAAGGTASPLDVLASGSHYSLLIL